MSTGFVPLAELAAGLTADDREFYSSVIKRDQEAHDEGSDKAGILRRILASEHCQKCVADFRRKHPEKPFEIKCQGIYDQPDYEQMQTDLRSHGEDMDIDNIREIYDPAHWASRHMVYKTEHGDILPVTARWYQEVALRCTASRKIDRWGRGMGKSFKGVCEELHFIANNKKTYTIVLCPSQAQAQMWWDEILFQLENSESLADMLLSKKQQPYYYFKFGNGSVLAIFTAGSKSGKGADSIRGQSPRRIRLDEQDYLAEKDYGAIMPLLRRFKESTFGGSSTPSGLRGMFWQMCNKLPEYREFFHPISDHPNWNTDQLNAISCMAEAQTMDKYRHEWLAEFGDPAAGVFKSSFVDFSLKPYRLLDCLYNPSRRYVMGIDWNGQGTGTRICIVEYDPTSRKRRVVAHETIDDPTSTMKKSFGRIVDLTKQWHCDFHYIDAGFGFVQDELIRDIGVQAGTFDSDAAKLKYINVIDFGAKLETNKIAPYRDPNSKYLPDPKEDILKRRTKPFMVEGVVMAFEMELVELSREYKMLEDQLRGYRVKTWTKGGQADVYVTDADSGDHDLDAFMLAMLGVELNYGLWHTTETVQRLVQIAHVSGWGLPATMVAQPKITAPMPQLADPEKPQSEQLRALKRESAGVPSRTPPPPSLQDQYRLMYMSRNSVTLAPNNSGRLTPGQGRVPSRTGMFGNTNRDSSGSSGRRFGGR